MSADKPAVATEAPDLGARDSATGAQGLRGKDLLEVLPGLLLAATAVVYAAGFLVVLAFLDRFGIREAGSDFWKARYIHIGILCVAFPLILNATLVALAYFIFHGKYDRMLMWQRLLPVAFLIANLEVVCYAFIMLTNRGQGADVVVGMRPLQWIVALTLVGLPVILALTRLLESRVDHAPPEGGQGGVSHSLTVPLRWILVVAVAICDVWYFSQLSNSLSGGSVWLALTYIAFSLLLGLVACTVALYDRRQATDGRKRAIVVLSLSAIGPFAYLTVLSFSYGIYQHIPSTRGGGDYTQAPRVVITLGATAPVGPKDKRFFSSESPPVTVPLIIIEETTWGLYLADPSDGGGPAEWKQIGGKKPEILALNKGEISRIHSESRVP